MRRIGLGAMIGAAAGLVAFLLSLAGALDTLEWKTLDWRLARLAGPGRVAERIAILLVDQKSLDHMAAEEDLPWPWPRSLYAPVIEYCRDAEARAVVFDLLFTEPSVYGEGDDAELGASVAGGGVILPFLAHAGDEGAPPPARFRPAPEGDGTVPAVPFLSATLPVESIRDGAAGLGNVLFLPDRDGVFRGVPAVFRSGGGAEALALPFAVWSVTEGTPVRADGGRLFLGDRTVPLDGEGRMLVRFRGPAGTIPSYSIASAIQSWVREREGGEISLPKELLRGRIVFIGSSAPGLLDLRPTPMSRVYPGVELHATVLDNLLAGDFLLRTPRWIEALRCVLAAALLGFLVGRARSPWRGALLLPLFVAVLAGAPLLFFRLGRWVPIVSPVLAVLLAFLAAQTAQYAVEGRRRRFLKHAFRHYLSPQVIEKILENPDRLALGGERKELTLFFSDLAGFTSLSEGLDPERLTALLNRYLSEMTDLIQAEGGTVDKYEGDAIIAFWNAPLDQPDHAARALRAGIGALRRLDEINPELERDAGRPLCMRIGIHTGSVVVGNMGSRERFDYSVIGDAANLASRLEGLGKVFRSPILVSEATWNAAEGAAAGREVGRVRVVGRREPTRVFQAAGPAGGPYLFPWWREGDRSFEEGLRAFEAGDLARAGEIFAALADDPVAGAYVDRIDALSGGALPPGWDGVWEMTSK
ncbi:MAG: adenylate/guanylate cyclase domain-containing protein [Candidatus Eisenbacteria bacterium]|nr:adenylate/guanylate cyclase domain-containing protein [Candidatus Eisenbacteria bacterium]